jgi:hypothetical protein
MQSDLTFVTRESKFGQWLKTLLSKKIPIWKAGFGRVQRSGSVTSSGTKDVPALQSTRHRH